MLSGESPRNIQCTFVFLYFDTLFKRQAGLRSGIGFCIVILTNVWIYKRRM